MNPMLSFVRRDAARRRGLTLMELVVVMAILIALAGIVIPVLPGIIGRAETSSRATNDSEIYKWIQTYEATTSAYPYDWDALVDGAGNPITYVSGFSGATPPLTVLTAGLSTTQAAALSSAGISRIQAMANGTVGTFGSAGIPTTSNTVSTFSDTFYPYPTLNDKLTDAIAVASGTKVVVLTAVGQAQLGLADNSTVTTVYGTGGTGSVPGTGYYVVFGLGKRCSLVGNGIADAPVNFFDKFTLDPSPTGSYGRYGVIFQVTGINGLAAGPVVSGTTVVNDFNRARLIKVVRFGGTLTTGDDAIKSYWDDLTTVEGS